MLSILKSDQDPKNNSWNIKAVYSSQINKMHYIKHDPINANQKKLYETESQNPVYNPKNSK